MENRVQEQVKQQHIPVKIYRTSEGLEVRPIHIPSVWSRVGIVISCVLSLLY